jgi:hypothetical protein
VVIRKFGIFPFWYVWTKKNLATLVRQGGFEQDKAFAL